MLRLELGGVARSVACALALPLGCGVPAFNAVDVASGQTIAITLAPLPPGRSFSGVYFSPQSGTTYVEQEGQAIGVRYSRVSCTCRVDGRGGGAVEGNLAELELRETWSGCAQSGQRYSRAVLFFKAPPEADRPARLYGWRSYRSTARQPSGKLVTEALPRQLWTAASVEPAGARPWEANAACP